LNNVLEFGNTQTKFQRLGFYPESLSQFTQREFLLNLLKIGEKPVPVCFDLANNVSTEKLVSIKLISANEFFKILFLSLVFIVDN
jgi:hypothetical protein